MEDPLVSTQTATNADYAKSGYDRGHLAPAADMSWSLQVMQESFYYSNMSPQLPGFNRGIWKKLEEKVRDWALRYDTLYVVTGPLLEPGLPTIGPNQVSIPKAYYKALIAPRQQKGIAFVLPNAKSDSEMSIFSMSIDALETKINRDLFYQLTDQLEQRIEAQREYWP
jgi:endonuclease G